MRSNLRTCLAALLIIFCAAAFGQRRAASDFQVTKITRNLISTPQYTYRGAEQFVTNQQERWLEVEVEFTSSPEFTDELTLKYFILLNGKLLSGEVTHVNIPAGRESRSVVYVSPRTLARFIGNRAVELAAIQNIAVQIVQQGVVKDEASLVRAQPQWFARVPQVAGFVLNKNETPFAPLYWDRYEQIRASSR
ncbi:MAG: Amuc_1102 family pilus-like protein [Chthoniobacterales bacterium]